MAFREAGIFFKGGWILSFFFVSFCSKTCKINKISQQKYWLFRDIVAYYKNCNKISKWREGCSNCFMPPKCGVQGGFFLSIPLLTDLSLEKKGFFTWPFGNLFIIYPPLGRKLCNFKEVFDDDMCEKYLRWSIWVGVVYFHFKQLSTLQVVFTPSCLWIVFNLPKDLLSGI